MFSFYIFFLLITIKYQNAQEIWQKHLSIIIAEKLQPYRTVLISCDSNQKIANNVLRQIMQKTPVLCEDYEKFTNHSILINKNDQNLRQTTLFIIILEIDNNASASEFEKRIDNYFFSLNRKSGARMRPKCLVILTKVIVKKFFSEIVLKIFWKYKYLDVSVLEIWYNNIVQLYYYNPFSEKIFQQLFTIDTNLFPDKLNNLHRYPLKALKSHKNTTNTLNNLLFGEMTKLISETLNTSIKEVSKKMGFKNLNKHFLYFDSYDFFKEPQIVKHNVNIENNENSNVIKYLEVVAVIPIFFNTKYQFQLKENFIYAGIFIIILIILIWIVNRLFKFNPPWKFINILQITLGMSVINEPKINSQRIFFIFIFLSWTIYSVWIYEELTTMFIKQRVEQKFSTLNDIIKLNLTLSFPNSDFKKDFVDATINSPEVHEKLENAKDNDKECLMKLIDYKDRICFKYKINVNIQIEKEVKKKLRHKITISDVLGQIPISMKMTRNSLYLRKFDELMLKIIEAGLNIKTYRNYMVHLIYSNQKNEEISNEGISLIKGLIYFLFTSYLIGIIVFIGEIIIYSRNFK